MDFFLFLNYITKIIIYFGMTKYFPNFFSKKNHIRRIPFRRRTKNESDVSSSSIICRNFPYGEPKIFTLTDI